MKAKSFEELEVWQRAMQLAIEVYELSRRMPSEERFGLSMQLRRAAVSIPSNIAEGSGYGRGRRNLHHVRIALGSDLELQTQLMLVKRLALAAPDRVQPAADLAIQVGQMLNGLIRSLESVSNE
jgi:four helix bundle protein